MENLEILKAQNGNIESMNKVLNFYKPLIKSVARKYFLMGGDEDDLIQEGMIGLLDAVNSFDENKNDFVPYAKKVVERKIINAVKKANSKKHFALNDCLQLDNQGDVVENAETKFSIRSNSGSPDKRLTNIENLKIVMNEISKNLSEFEKLVLNFYIMGYNYKEIATKLKKDSKSIDNAITRIKRKLNFLFKG